MLSVKIKGGLISNLDELQFFTNLTGLNIANQILGSLSSIDLSSNLSLRYLTLDEPYSFITGDVDIDLTSNVQLEEIVIYGINELKSLNINTLVNLRKLDVRVTAINEIDLSNNIYLEDFYFSNNPLNSIDITNNAALLNFTLLNGDIQNIDFSNNGNLQEVFIHTQAMLSVNFDRVMAILVLNNFKNPN